MHTPKDILVSSTSTLEGIPIKQYLKPISAHVVAGTNLFSDFFASFSDVFGGRSTSYQRQLMSLYNEATERIKLSAFEIGANAIVGFKVDLDEISGKGKSMFMVTATGTAVILEHAVKKNQIQNVGKLENVPLDQLRALNKKKDIIQRAENDTLGFDDTVWEFITSNQIDEIFTHVLVKLEKTMGLVQSNPETLTPILLKVQTYIDGLPYEKKVHLLYNSISKVESPALANHLIKFIENLSLLDFEQIHRLLNLTDFKKQKRALKILTFDKAYYNQNDINEYKKFIELIKQKFPEKGSRISKKQFLSSKEKEMWVCECKNTVEIGKYCGACKTDIYGFTADEFAPPKTIGILEYQIELLNELV